MFLTIKPYQYQITSAIFLPSLIWKYDKKYDYFW